MEKIAMIQKTFPLNSNNKQSYISVTYNTIHILTVKTQWFLHKNT
jgi:hypothetical protein